MQNFNLPQQADRTGSGARMDQRGRLIRSNQRGNKLVQSGAGTNLIVGVLRRPPDSSIREQLPRKRLAQHQKFHGFSKRNFAIKKRDVLLAPWQIQFCFDRVERNLFGELLKTLFVELDSVHVVTNEEFIQLLRGSPFHGVQKLKNGEKRFLLRKHAFCQLSAT